MFKHATVCRIGDASFELPTASDLAELLATSQFAACTGAQSGSYGFTPPRGPNGALMESIEGVCYIGAYTSEVKVLPGDAVRRRAQLLAVEYEHSNGCKPGRKVRAELKEQARTELTLTAPTRMGRTLFWIIPRSKLLIIDSASSGAIDRVVSALAGTCGFSISPVQTVRSAAGTMHHWLMDFDAGELSLGRNARLRGADHQSVTYRNTDLDSDELRLNLQRGMNPTSVEVSTGRASFSLVEGSQLTLKGLHLADAVFLSRSKEHHEAFDADVLLAATEVTNAIAMVLTELGGELPEKAAATEEAAE